MRKLLFIPLVWTAFMAHGQDIVNAWVVNNSTIAQYYLATGVPPNVTYVLTSTGDLANVQQVCYTNDSVWVETTGMAEIMGPYLNPGAPTDQGFVWRFPRTPQTAVGGNTTVPIVFTTGVLLTGVSIFGNGDATSYDAGTSSNLNNGDGLWNVDAWYGEGFTLDTLYGAHVNQTGCYHTHATPYTLYADPSTTHSPLIGFAFDGYPVYGPFGYVDPTNASSGVTRMESGYQLRSITTRTTLPDGSTSSPPGPNVNTTFPLGMYIEDYEFVGTGDLDVHNGRYTVTPEFPGGTYAYFVATDGNGDPFYPYFFGETYYGEVDEINLDPTNPTTTPSSGVTCGLTSMEVPLGDGLFSVFPNPTYDEVTLSFIKMEEGVVRLTDAMGREMVTAGVSGTNAKLNLDGLPAGLYFASFSSADGDVLHTARIIRK